VTGLPIRSRQSSWPLAFACALFVLGTLGQACSSRASGGAVNLPPPIESNTVAPGDVFTMEVVGEKELPKEYQIAADGTVDLPYVHTVKVVGLSPQGIARLVREKLIEGGLLKDPAVVVQVKEYASRKITLLGQVSKPGSFPLLSGMTLIQAISSAGGLTSIASSGKVSLTRKTETGQRTVVVDVDAIIEGRANDIPLQAGDQIYVRERIF
jgi:protein involved in polysaccharide export with SLBB domain